MKVYEIIFQTIQKRDLQRDILLYSYGIFSLLPLAALTVKPVLLNIYESYFLPLGEALNPVLSGFLIGLFSALEEGADYYDQIITLLDHLANRTDEFYFYTSLWSAINLAAPVRHSAMTFVLNHFDKRKTIEDQFHLIGLSTQIMVCRHFQTEKNRFPTVSFVRYQLFVHVYMIMMVNRSSNDPLWIFLLLVCQFIKNN